METAMDAFEAVAVCGGVPFATEVSGETVRRVFASGEVPAELAPHIDRIRNELPIALLARLVFAFPKSERDTVIANFGTLARTFGAEARIDAWLNG